MFIFSLKIYINYVTIRWWFTKGLLAAKTVEKINVTGSNFAAVLAHDIDVTMLPVCLGGRQPNNPQPFEFDTSENGLLYWSEQRHLVSGHPGNLN